MDKQLTVRVGLQDGNKVGISVVDNGVGISAGNLPRIFDHGFTTRRNGLGFGLHSSFRAAQELGGSLTVHSDGAGKGSAFTLELPLRRPRNPPANIQLANSDSTVDNGCQ
jgi:signal transduction histidine kinase